MFDHEWVSGLDAGAACEAVAAAHADLREVECRQLVLAAHWIDLHAPVEEDAEPDAAEDTGPAGPGGTPGVERVVRVGADGTPQIGEFACAEFAALQDLHPLAGAALLRKVANLRHRHPLLWGRVLAGEVRGWKALEVARIVGKDDYALTLEQARWVDAQTHAWIDTLPWGSFLSLVEARIIAADPESAELRRKEAEARRYVTSGRAGEQGLKTFIARAVAGDVIRVVALCERIADILAEQGDPNPRPVLRSIGFGMLANPARVLALLARHAGTAQDDNADRAADDDAEEAAGEPDRSHREDPDLLDSGDLHPADDDADDAAEQPPCPACGRADSSSGGPAGGLLGGDPAGFVKRLPTDLLDRVLPKARLYIHVTEHALATGQGVARMEGFGPITLGQVRGLLTGSTVTAVRVLDPAGLRPVDGYEFPSTMREATLAVSPRDVFPWATSTSRRRDLDHPNPYLPPARGGPPGQTRLGNAAPMIRFHHRLKTHGRWRVRQPEPGSYLWRSPHGFYWLTTPTGTHRLPQATGRTLWDALDKGGAPPQSAQGVMSRSG